jgi:hypothetical protein
MARSAAALAKEVTAQEITTLLTETINHESIQDSIAARAYELWQERGCPDGNPETDWFAAEAEILGTL